MGVPQNWTDDGTTLTAPNNNTVTGVHRNFVLNHDPQWLGGLVPLTDTLDVNATTGDVTQLFGLAVTAVKQNQSVVENPGSVPAAKTASLQAVDATVNALSLTLQQLQQVVSNLTSLLSSLESTTGAS